MIGAIAALSAAPAHARDYYYFNKPGVDRTAYLEDRVTCDELAGGVARKSPEYDSIRQIQQQQIWQNRNLTTGQAAVASGVASFLTAFMAAGERRRLSFQIERICLADKGYKRFEMAKTDFNVIEKAADDAARIDGWFALASAAVPSGKEMPE